MKDLITKLKQFSTFLVAGATLDGYRRLLNDEAKTRELAKITEKLDIENQKVELLKAKLQIKLDGTDFLEAKRTGIKSRVLDYLDHHSKNGNKLTELRKSPEENKELIETINRESEDILRKASSEINDLIESVQSERNSLSETLKTIIDSDNSDKFISTDSLNSLFSNLSSEQLGALAHILVAIVIYYCVTNIAVSYYGDKLIIYYKLETRYP